MADYVATNSPPPVDLAPYATRAYADAVASNAQASAESAIPSLEGYATQQDVVDYFDARFAQGVVIEAETTRLATPNGLTWQDATGVVWQVELVYGWAGTVWTNSQDYSAASTGFTYQVVFSPDGSGAYTNASWGALRYTELGWLWEPDDSADIYNGIGTGNTNVFEVGAMEYATGHWYSANLAYGPIGTASTNAIRRVAYTDETTLPGNYAAVSNAAMNARSMTDLNVRGAPQGEWSYFLVNDESVVWVGDHEDPTDDGWYGSVHISPLAGGYYGLSTGWGDITNFMLHGEDYSATLNVGGETYYIQGFVGALAQVSQIPDVPSWALQEEKPTYSATEVGAAPATVTNDLADLRTESALVYRLYSGSNVVAEVTNYNSQVHAPSLRLMQLNESNEYVTVWTETNGLARTLRDATNYTDRAIADYAAPRAWSRTTSGLGAEAPANTTWISTPTTVIAGGFEYAKFVDTYGEVWVLTSNGMAAEFNPDTNAYFRITADDGTPVFSVEKTDAQLVGANAAGITVSESTITIPVPVVSSTEPTMYWRASLSSGDWADESSPPTGATVTWSGTAGTWVCTVAFTGSRPPMLFFKFNFLQEGAVVIRNNATTDLSSGIWVNGTKFVPSVSGNNLIWTKQ